MRLNRLTWPECRDAVARETRLIVPVGTCEQHGKHLPLDTDTRIVEHVAEWLSEETGVLVAPTVSYGVNLPCDRFFSGTASVTPEALTAYAGSLLSWWRLQGFTAFALLSAHGDPVHLDCLRACGSDDVHLLEVWDVEIADLLEAQTACGHACEAETSVMLHLYPEVVRTAAIEDFQSPWEEFKPYLLHQKTEPLQGSPGNQGFPSRATTEKGAAILRRMQTRALDWLLCLGTGEGAVRE
ncbi:creatininase family protein [Planctomycetota bacterium]